MPKPAPEELENIRRIFLAICGEPWFNRNAVTERELLKVVFHLCVGSVDGPDTIARLCEEEARRRFSRPD